MKHLLPGLQLAIFGVFLSTMVACSGSSGHSSRSAAPGTGGGGAASQDGQIVDNPIAGLRYVSGDISGITTLQGGFSCEIGETVSFYLDLAGDKNILLGQVTCRTIISPVELITNGSETIFVDFDSLSEETMAPIANMLRLIQSLDLDRDPSNGINLHSSVLEDVCAYLEEYVAEDDSEEGISTILGTILADEDFPDFLSDLMVALGRPGAAVSENDAIDSFDNYRETCTEEGCPESAVEQYVCLSGYTLLNKNAAFTSVVDTSNGTVVGDLNNSHNKRLGKTLIVLRNDLTSSVYRRVKTGTSNADFFSEDKDYSHFEAGWNFSGVTSFLSATNIPFFGSIENYQFEEVANLGVDSVAMSEISSAASTQNPPNKIKLTDWSVSYNCPLYEAVDPHDLGSTPPF